MASVAWAKFWDVKFQNRFSHPYRIGGTKIFGLCWVIGYALSDETVEIF